MDRRKLLAGLGLSEEQIAPLLTADIGRIIVDGEPAIQVDDRFSSTLIVTFPPPVAGDDAPCLARAPLVTLIDAVSNRSPGWSDVHQALRERACQGMLRMTEWLVNQGG